MRRYYNKETGLSALIERGNISKECLNCKFHHFRTPANGGYGTHYCKHDTYDNKVFYYPFEDRFKNNLQTISMCNKMESKFEKVKNPTTKLDLLRNQIFDLGFYIDYNSISDLESGTYFCYSIINLSTGASVESGCPYNLENILINFMEKIQNEK